MLKKSVSPLIATVLLIAFTVAIGSVVMNWGTSYIKEEQTKATSTSDVRLTCATDVSLKVMKIHNMKDYCYTNDSENVTITVRLTKGTQILKGIRANIISNDESQSSNYNKEIDELNFQLNLGGFSKDVIKNNLIEYLELVPYIDNQGLDYHCSGSSLVISDLYPCGFEINNAYSGDNSGSGEPESTVGCTTYSDCSSGQFCDIYGFNNDVGTCVDFCEGGPEPINQTIYADGIGLEYTQALFGSNFTIDSDWNYSCKSYGTTLNDDLCPEGMAFINKLGGYCIDKYEAHAINMTTNESVIAPFNVISGFKAGSASNKTPWMPGTLSQSRQACINAGKYLCTNAQWQGAANLNGTLHNLDSVSIYGCVVNSSICNYGPCKTGYNKNEPNNCVSYEGVYDLFGNVYDKVNETIAARSSNEGYKYLSDFGLWSSMNESIYGGGVDFPSGTYSAYMVTRGGYYNSNTVAGPFNAELRYWSQISYGYNIFGFRCCNSTKQS